MLALPGSLSVRGDPGSDEIGAHKSVGGGVLVPGDEPEIVRVLDEEGRTPHQDVWTNRVFDGVENSRKMDQLIEPGLQEVRIEPKCAVVKLLLPEASLAGPRARSSASPSAASTTGSEKARSTLSRVVDVLQQVALDVAHCAQLRHAREPLGRLVGLADQRDRVGEMRVELGGVGLAVLGPDGARLRAQPRPQRVGEDQPPLPPLRVEEDDGGAHDGGLTTSGSASVCWARNHSRSCSRCERRPSAVRASSWPTWTCMLSKRKAPDASLVVRVFSW